LAGNPVKPLLSLYGTEWRERGYGLCAVVLTNGRPFVCRLSSKLVLVRPLLVRNLIFRQHRRKYTAFATALY
jgi:hypothetical protein